MSRASWAVAEECILRMKEVAAKTHGGEPADYQVANQRVFRKGGGAGLSFAEAAKRAIVGGIYDGHEANPDVNSQTRLAVAGLTGQRVGGLGQRQIFVRWRSVLVFRELCRGGGGY